MSRSSDFVDRAATEISADARPAVGVPNFRPIGRLDLTRLSMVIHGSSDPYSGAKSSEVVTDMAILAEKLDYRFNGQSKKGNSLHEALHAQVKKIAFAMAEVSLSRPLTGSEVVFFDKLGSAGLVWGLKQTSLHITCSTWCQRGCFMLGDLGRDVGVQLEGKSFRLTLALASVRGYETV